MFLSYSIKCLGQEHDNSFVFRKVRWGMVKDEVVKTESLELIKTVKLDSQFTNSFGPDETITYIGEDQSREVLIIYGFLGNYLTNIIQIFTEQYEDKALYIEAYDMHKTALTEQYGLPVEIDDSGQDDGFYDSRAIDLDAGNLSPYATWENDITRVDLLLQKDTHADKIILMISYSSKLISREN